MAVVRGVRLAEYTPRDPSASVLYAVVRDLFETFRTDSSGSVGVNFRW